MSIKHSRRLSVRRLGSRRRRLRQRTTGGGDGASTVDAERRAAPRSRSATSRSPSARPAPTTAGRPRSPTTRKAQAKELDGVTLKLAEGVTDSAEQADQIETLIAGKPDVLVVLPNEGDALTPVAQKAMDQPASRSSTSTASSRSPAPITR